MAIINTNLLSLNGQNHLKRSHSAMETAMERLSSGLRVNGAKDDAAGQAIANRMEANLRANDTITRGINDGISLMQTAEGGLDGINDILHRSRELAVQAANGTLSDADRASLNAEYKELRNEIDRIALGTQAFGKYPLAPASVPPVQLGDTPSIVDLPIEINKDELSGIRAFRFIPEGVEGFRLAIHDHGQNDDIQIFAKDGSHVVGSRVPDTAGGVWRNVTTGNIEAEVLLSQSGFDEGAKYNDSELNVGVPNNPHESKTTNFRGMAITYSGDANASGSHVEYLVIDKVTEPLFIFVTGNGSFNFSELRWDSPAPPEELPTSEETVIATSANFGDKMGKITIKPTPSDHVSLGLEDVELDPIEKAREAMAKLMEALNQVDGYRSQYGALHNRFESAIENLATQSINTAAARSRIMDADYAVESAAMVKAQILQQAGTTMLAQANQVPQNVLPLLKGSA